MSIADFPEMGVQEIRLPVGGGENPETTSLRFCVAALEVLGPWSAHRVAEYLVGRYPEPDPDS